MVWMHVLKIISLFIGLAGSAILSDTALGDLRKHLRPGLIVLLAIGLAVAFYFVVAAFTDAQALAAFVRDHPIDYGIPLLDQWGNWAQTHLVANPGFSYLAQAVFVGLFSGGVGLYQFYKVEQAQPASPPTPRSTSQERSQLGSASAPPAAGATPTPRASYQETPFDRWYDRHERLIDGIAIAFFALMFAAVAAFVAYSLTHSWAYITAYFSTFGVQSAFLYGGYLLDILLVAVTGRAVARWLQDKEVRFLGFFLLVLAYAIQLVLEFVSVS